MKKTLQVLSLILLGALALSACGPQATESPTEPVVEAPTETEEPSATETPVASETLAEQPTSSAPEGALVALPVEAAPTLDGVGDEPFWADAQEIVVPVSGGANMGSTDVHIKTVYTNDEIYFLVSYADPSESFFRSPWQKNEDGTWTKVTDPADKGGDNNTVYEDKLAFIWPINNSIPQFETTGCFIACHAGENSDVKPYGNKYTANEGELGDIWHWKSVRNLGQVDDQYLDSTPYSADTPEAGRHSDPNDGGGYVNNETEAKDAPAFTSPAVDLTTGAPGFILDNEKVALDQAAMDAMPAGSYVPSIIKSEFTGDRADISAGWVYADGAWTLEFGRKLVTGSEFDVQFEDLAATYYFGVAAFDNAQVRHALQPGASMLVFQP